MVRYLIFLCAFVLFATAADAHTQTRVEKDYGLVSNYLLVTPFLAGAGVAAYKSDGEGEKQLIRTTLAGIAATEAVKYAAHGSSWDQKPNGGDFSFPSDHTAFACSSSAFMGKRYGWKYGLASFGVAAAIGTARVEASQQHVRDVVTGCALSYGVNEFFVTKQGEENLTPVVGPKFIGFRWRFAS